MLKDKTQFLNRLQNSNLTCKSTAFGQNIRNPYLAQLKIFEQRLKNPKLKCRSVIMRKKITQIDVNKENFQKQIKKFQQQDCLKEAKKILNNQNDIFSILHFKTIGDDLDEKQKQEEVVSKFKTKINDLKMIKIMSNNIDDRQRNSFNYLRLTSKNNLSETSSVIDSQRKMCLSTKPNTPSDIFERKRQNFDIKMYRNSHKQENKQTKKLKLPLTFINYKRSKSLAERFTIQRK